MRRRIAAKVGDRELEQRGGQGVVKALAAKCDVVLENYSTATLDGTVWATRSEGSQSRHHLLLRDRLRPERPYLERPGYDFMIQGMGR